MNISKKAIMSFFVALISVVSMAQPYYHIMKDENGKLTEETGYDSKDYKIKIDMDKPKPKDAVGGMITIESYDCDMSPLKRSFYFTNKGNVEYDYVYDKFYFANSQLSYEYGMYSMNMCGHFAWGDNIDVCIRPYPPTSYPDQKETYFYFANPENLARLQENLGNEKWGVLSACEWDYVIRNLGEPSWEITGEGRFFLIDTTPGKSLLNAIKSKNRGEKRMTRAQFYEYQPQGLVALPSAGYRSNRNINRDGGYYWSCTPCGKDQAYCIKFSGGGYAGLWTENTRYGCAVRLVILVDD